MRSVPEPSSVGGSSTSGRDPWAGFGAGPVPGGRSSRAGGTGGRDPGDDRAVADIARRLQDRVDGQEALLDRVADLALRPDDRARVTELRDAARRMRRDSEVLLLLCGTDPGVHRGTPLTVPGVLGDAVAVVDEPSRVVVRSAPAATLAAAAAVELRHLVAELVDEASSASPGSRIEVGARMEPDGALVVEVVVAGRGWTDALGGSRGGYGASPRLAERLARRSTGGIRLERPLIDSVEGLVAALHCPAALVTAAAGDDPWQLSSLSGPSTYGSSSYGSSSYGSSSYGSSPPADPSLLLSSLPSLSRSGGDELFGPLPAAAAAIGTPIFEAVASAWFRDDDRAPRGDDWNSPGDLEWRAAAARASRADVPDTTASGLPRRSPGDRLVPPPRSAGQASTPRDDRVPERVRDRLATYQRGLQQGRHRAADPAQQEPADSAPEAWTADGW